MTDRELMQQALDVLEDIFGKNKVDVGIITALRERLAQPENGGPKTPPKQPASRMNAGFEGGPNP